MLRNHLIVAVRNLLRHKVYSFINISGLAVGTACCLLMVLYVLDELSYDEHHRNADQIYRVLREVHTSEDELSFNSGTSGALAPALSRDYPEVREAVRIIHWGDAWISYENKKFNQSLYVADKSVFDVFTFPLLKGDLAAFLQQPSSILITEEMAMKYFGDEDPLGKVLTVENAYLLEGEYQVAGVLKNVPRNSMLRFDFLTTTVSEKMAHEWWDSWLPSQGWKPVTNYLMLPAGYDRDSLEKKLPKLIGNYMPKEAAAQMSYRLQPLKEIYLSPDKVANIYLLSAIALFILLLACINFMNLATARSIYRAKEVGIRKVVGAHRLQLIRQFLGESTLQSLLALLLALGLIELVLPLFNSFVDKELALDANNTVLAFLGALSFVVLAGVLAGGYPAFFLSAFQPVEVLKGNQKGNSRRTWLRNTLVVFQFSISTFFMVGTFIIYYQLEYVRDKDLGFNKEFIVCLPLFAKDRSLIQTYEEIKNEFLKHPGILNAAASNGTPAGGGFLNTVRLGDEDRERSMSIIMADYDFLDTYGIELVAGRNFSKEITSDLTDAFILNETAVEQLGWTAPIGQPFEWISAERKGTVIGVVKDFHYRSLHDRVAPLFICQERWVMQFLTLRIHPENVPETMAFIRQKWQQFLPDHPFTFEFFDDSLDNMYQREIRFATIAQFSSFLAIFIACLGLFSLAALTTEQRSKEIGIRKVLGASVPSIIALLSKEFTWLVVMANLIAWPVAYFLMKDWLRDFAYRIELGWESFVLGAILSLIIAWLTVSYQAIRAALANPVDTLRSE